MQAMLLVCVAVFTAACTAPNNQPADTGSRLAIEPAVASAHPLATRAGIEALEAGGNAFDAAVAVTAALAVVEPYSSGIGGGGFYLLYQSAADRYIMIDARETAPLAAHRDMYLDAAGEVVPRASVDGPLSAGIPGIPAALEHLAGHYGGLPLSESLAASIRYAESGFRTDARYQRLAGFRENALNASADAARIFLRDNKAPAPGTRIVQKELAETLRRIAADGAAGFYRGDIASKLIASVQQHGGIWSRADFDRYRVIEREPVTGTYRGMKVVSAAPPSSGGIAIMQMLNLLSAYELERLTDVQHIHLLAESMRRAYRDRAEYLGDPDFVDVPVERLLSIEHARTIGSNISLENATPSETLPAIVVDAGKAADTTHFSIVDAAGNRVSATLSINYPFGSGFVAEGTGVLLNDEMDDFSAKPGVPNVYGLVGAEANAVAPGKRMLSSMSPTILETGDRFAIVGTPGGSRIITMVMLAMLDFFNGGDAQSMVDAGRYHHQYLPDKLFYEPGVFSDDVLLDLSELGHETEVGNATWGNMQAIVVDRRTGKTEAASDRRGGGEAVVLDQAVQRRDAEAQRTRGNLFIELLDLE